MINSDFVSNLVGLYQRTIIVARYGGRVSIGANNDDSIIDFITGLSVDELKKKSLNSYKLPKTEFIDSPALILSSLCQKPNEVGRCSK